MTDPTPTPTPATPRPPSRAVLAITILLLAVNMLLARAVGVRAGETGPSLTGRAFGPVGIALIVLGVARLIGRGKTRRAQLNIVMWTMVVAMLAQCATLGQAARP